MGHYFIIQVQQRLPKVNGGPADVCDTGYSSIKEIQLSWDLFGRFLCVFLLGTKYFAYRQVISSVGLEHECLFPPCSISTMFWFFISPDVSLSLKGTSDTSIVKLCIEKHRKRRDLIAD